jgi:Zn-dependent peptidase ImmA (M78 family)
MRSVDTLELYKIAENEGIIIENWDFTPPLEAIYWFESGIPPIIGVSNHLLTNSTYYRCVLAEELGHYFTTSGTRITNKNMNYRERLHISKVEYKAMKWAAEFLIPIKLLKRAIIWDCNWTHYHLAEYFDVTIDMLKFRLSLPDVGRLIEYTKFKRYG